MANALSVAPPKEREKNTYSLANVTVRETKIRFTLYDKKTKKLNPEAAYTFLKVDLPKQHSNLEDGDDCLIGLTPDLDEIIKIGPAEGIFKAKVKDFIRPEEGADPVPLDVPTNFNGKEGIKRKFTPIFEIVRGSWKGVEVPHFLEYRFDHDEDGNAMWLGDPVNPKAFHLPRLIEFCEKTGCVESPIEWPEDGNILPELLKRILQKNKTVDLVIKGGYIDSILATDLYEEEAPAAKSPAKDEFEESAEDEFEEPVKPVKKNGKNGKKDTKSDL